MGQQKEHKASVPVPLYVLLFIVIGLCAWSFWIGTVCVRLWFYKGALGPVPEKFIIIPHHRKEKEPAQAQSLPPPTIKNGRNTVFPTVAHLNCNTVFPAVAHLATKPTNPFSDDHAVPDASEEWRTIPKITIEDSDEPFDNAIAQEYADPARVRKFLAEERRISRLPTFDQDDCGDGSEFPEVPYAIAPVEPWAALTYRQLGLQKVNNTSAWLTINNSYIEHHEARMSLLERKQADCVQVRHDGEAACEELADLVVQHLCKAHPDHFTAKLKGRRRHVRNELASKEYALVRPFDCHPLGLCARLAVEDFCIWRRGEFTLGWYFIRHALPGWMESPPPHREIPLIHYQRPLRALTSLARSPRHSQPPLHPHDPIHPPHNLHPNPLPDHPAHINFAHPAPRRLLLRRRAAPRPAKSLHTPRVSVVSAAGQVRRGGHDVAHGID